MTIWGFSLVLFFGFHPAKKLPKRKITVSDASAKNYGLFSLRRQSRTAPPYGGGSSPYFYCRARCLLPNTRPAYVALSFRQIHQRRVACCLDQPRENTYLCQKH